MVSSRPSANRCLIGWPADLMAAHNGLADKYNCCEHFIECL